MNAKLTSWLCSTKSPLLNRVLRRSPVIGCVLMLSFTQPSEAQEASASASFEDWSVFEDEVACWAASEAFQELNESTAQEERLMFVTFFYGSQTPEISFNVGSCCGKTAYARINEHTLSLIYDDETYFPAVNEIDFLLQALRSDKLEIVDTETNEIYLRFSLIGFREAYNHLARTCNFN